MGKNVLAGCEQELKYLFHLLITKYMANKGITKGNVTVMITSHIVYTKTFRKPWSYIQGHANTDWVREVIAERLAGFKAEAFI